MLRRALDDASLAPADIDEVVLVGGSTRIPHVRRRVEAELGTMLRHTLANLGVAKTRLDRETFEDLTDAIAAAESAQSSLDLPTVQSARDTLDRATIPLAAVLMDDVVKQAVSGKKLSEV